MSSFFAHPSILISASQLEPAIVLAYRVLRVERTNYPSLTSLLVFRVSSRLCIGQSEHALDWMKHKIHVDDKATLRPPATQPKESEVELRPVSNLSERPANQKTRRSRLLHAPRSPTHLQSEMHFACAEK